MKSNHIKMFFLGLVLLCAQFASYGQERMKLALLKYSGGGDWYANPTSLPNLIAFCNSTLGTNLDTEPATVEPGDPSIFNYPFLHMTGHGNVVFTAQECDNLRKYLTAGGFLHIDDNYGMDVYVRRELKKLFSDADLVELPVNHPIFNQKFTFPNGVPKIHEHDNKPPKAFGIYIDDRLVVLYTYESDLGDGWEDQRVHNDSEATRTKALQMGANLIQYVFTQ